MPILEWCLKKVPNDNWLYLCQARGAGRTYPSGARSRCRNHPIDSLQNTNGGTHLLQFYTDNRILDENVGTDQTRPTDPFRVAVTG